MLPFDVEAMEPLLLFVLADAGVEGVGVGSDSGSQPAYSVTVSC